MRTMTLAQISNVLDCNEKLPAAPVLGYCIDSRSISPGELFFALKGEKVDSHIFLQEIQRAGACGAVVSKNYEGQSFGLPLIRVDDPLEALQSLAKTLLAADKARIVGITGSLGKTSTKEFTKHLLSTKYRVFASPGNSNSQVGLPLSILNHSTGKEEVFVIEMGMTLPGQITRLIEIAPPEVAVITTVALVHACNFETIEEIGLAKGEIFSHPATVAGILAREIPNYSQISRIGMCRKLSFSTVSTNVDYYLNLSDLPILHTQAEGLSIKLNQLPVPGEHNYHNLLAAIAVAKYFNIGWDEINQAISTMILPDRRLQFVSHKGILFLNDAYNAAEVSVKAALESLPEPEGAGRKIAVLGGMAELGKFSHDCHQRVGEFALERVEKMYCLGEECLPIYDVWRKAGRAVELFTGRADLVDSLKKDLRSSDVVLLKGSRSKELWKVLEEI